MQSRLALCSCRIYHFGVIGESEEEKDKSYLLMKDSNRLENKYFPYHFGVIGESEEEKDKSYLLMKDSNRLENKYFPL
jgi:hypothetical protein